MKKPVFIIVLLSFATLISAQENNRYIFNNTADIKMTYFVGPVIKVTRLIDKYELYTGLRAGMLYNDKFGFGLAGGGFVTEELINGLNKAGEMAELNTVVVYGGFSVDYLLHTNSPVSVSFPMLVGAAGLILFGQHEGLNGVLDEEMVEGGVFFIYEPSVCLELTMTKFLRTGVGIGYRLAFRGDMDRVSRKDLSNVTFNCSFKFGSY
jgi:hypothetical protein